MGANPIKSGPKDHNARPMQLQIQIDGSDLTTTTGIAGVDVGADSVTAKDDGANIVTVTFRQAMRNTKYLVHIQAHKAGAPVEIKDLTKAAGSFTYTTVDGDSHGTAADDADTDILVTFYDTSSVR